LFFFIILLTGGVSAGERLTSDELKEFYNNKTIVGVHYKSGPQKTYYGSDGMVYSQSANGAKRTGKWWIDGGSNKRCVKWDNESKDKCHYTERNSDGTYTLIHGKKGKKLVEISNSMDGNQF